MASSRVTDDMVRSWLIWARNLGEIVAFNDGRGPYVRRSGPRRWRIRLAPGVTNDGNPPRAKQGIFDLFGHEEKDIVPAELMLTSREALVFGMGCAVGRAATVVGAEHDWHRERLEAWTPEAREAFARWREEAREADRASLERERAEWEAERQRRMAEYRRRKEAASRVIEPPEP